MSDARETVDLTYAKTPMFVRQAVAIAIGAPMESEPTWEILQDWISKSEGLSLPKRILVRGLPKLALVLPQEERQLRNLLRALHDTQGVEVQVVIHD